MRARIIVLKVVLITIALLPLQNHCAAAGKTEFCFDGYPQKLGKQFLVFQSVITPDGVYPGFSGKLL